MLYHLVSAPAEAMAVPGVQEALGDLRIPTDARVLVFDGQEAGTEPVLKEDGAAIYTLWGELAHQAGAYRRVMDSDGRGEAPGNAVFRQVLEEASPCLILLDELVSYLVKLRYSNVRRTQNLYWQTVQFLQETLQLASNVPGVCVLISLPKSRREFGGLDPDQLQRELIRGLIKDDNRTAILLAPGDENIGAIVRNPETGRWRYDDAMREVLGITDNPEFATDGEAGNELEHCLPPLEQLHDVLRQRRQLRQRTN